METDRKLDKWFNGKDLIPKAIAGRRIYYVQLGKLAVVRTASDFRGIGEKLGPIRCLLGHATCVGISGLTTACGEVQRER